MGRISISLLAASGCAHAAWLRWSINREAIWAPRETNHVTESELVGWTPRPTPAPGVRNDGEKVLDLLRRQSTDTDWTNPETCGWFSGISSSAYMCGNGFTCATNSDHAVACASGTFSPFYTACLDYSAFQAGSCASLDPATGCCEAKTRPACGTYIWTGKPERFMYQCFETASIVSLLDVPQFVVDASIFSKTHTTPQSTSTETGAATGTGVSASSPGETQGTQGSSSGSGSGSGPGNAGADSTNTTNNSSGSSSTPAIVGGVVGGIIGLLLLLLLLFWLLRRGGKGKLGLGFTRNNKSKKEKNAKKAYHTTNIGAAATAKRKDSSSSETVTATAVPISLNLRPQHHYHNREKNNYHTEVLSQSRPQAQPQHVQLHQQLVPQNQGQAGGQQPVSMSYTVNEGTTHMRQPSYTSNTSYTMPSAPSGTQPHIVVGGIVPTSHQSNEAQHPQHANEGTTHTRESSYTNKTSYAAMMPPAQSGAPHHFVVGGIVPTSQPSNESQQPQGINEGTAHMRQPSHTSNTSYTTMQSAPSGAANHFVVGGIVPMSHHSNESQPQHQFQQPQAQFQQMQQIPQVQHQQPIQPHLQPVNHIHVYYAPPVQTEQHAQNLTPQSQIQSTNITTQTQASATADALGLFTQPHHERTTSQDRAPRESHDQGHKHEYQGHSRDVSTQASRSVSPELDWLGGRGPGYRQSM